MDALGLTDHGNLYGAIEFYKECKKQGIKPIIGMEAYVAPGRRTDRRPKIDDQNYHLTLLAQDETGYKNLIQLSSIAHLEGFYYKPRVDHDLLRTHAAGLIALTGCLSGEIPRALQSGDEERALRLLREYQEMFGSENVYVEVQDHPEIPLVTHTKEKLIGLAKRAGAPLAATKDSHYLHPEDAEAQDLMLCIQMGKPVGDPTRMSMRDADYSLVSREDMYAAFPDHPEAVENTAAIADRCNLELKLGKWNFPPVELPEGKTAENVLRERAISGVAAIYGGALPEEVHQRLAYELDVICTKGFAPYFLTVADCINWARTQGIITTTRGSAAGCLVSYVVGITTVDPLFFKLPFERFLNPSRPSPPDIDMDYADNRRDEVLAYVTLTYGSDHVAQICTFGTMLARAAVRDITRSLGFPYALGDRIAKLIPLGSQGFPMTIARAVMTTPELAALRDAEPDVRRVLDLAVRIEGCVRHVSVHAAGVVISPTPLTDFTPLQHEPGGDRVITQYDMHAVESAGLLKMDFLGIRNLSILGRAVEIIRERRNVSVSINQLPLDDKKTFELLARGDTVGLFQLGGSGMTRYLVDMRPTTIHDIMALVALYRPGPIDSIPEYIRRKHNPRLVRTLDPRMKPILEQSFGIITYQDDVLLIAIELAGYTWQEADKLRKAIGKKIPKEMAAQKDKFTSGCVAHGMPEEKARELWGLIETFAAYGFNKAHAASYAMVAYQTAYLKANYPAEYMTAALSAESDNLEKVAEAITECRKMGIPVLPPDVNESDRDFSLLADGRIRFGLNAIKNLGTDLIESVASERAARGAFTSIDNFLTRLTARTMNKKSLEALIMAGAFDGFGDRNVLRENVLLLLHRQREAASEAVRGQASLFGAAALGAAPIRLKSAPPADRHQLLAWEKELLGLYVTAHPFSEAAVAFGNRLMKIDGLRSAPPGTMVTFGGVVQEWKVVTTKAGERMGFLLCDDASGGVETIVFPKLYARIGASLAVDQLVLVAGKRSEKDEEVRILADRVVVVSPSALEDAWRAFSAPVSSVNAESVTIDLPRPPDQALAEQLKTVLESAPGATPVFIRFQTQEGTSRLVATPFRVAWGRHLSTQVRDLTAASGRRSPTTAS